MERLDTRRDQPQERIDFTENHWSILGPSEWELVRGKFGVDLHRNS